MEIFSSAQKCVRDHVSVRCSLIPGVTIDDIAVAMLPGDFLVAYENRFKVGSGVWVMLPTY